MAKEIRSGKKAPGKKLRLKRQDVKDLDAKRGGIRGGQSGQPSRGGPKPIMGAG